MHDLTVISYSLPDSIQSRYYSYLNLHDLEDTLKDSRSFAYNRLLNTPCRSLIIKLPVLSAHGTQLRVGLRVQPLNYAVHMETMGTNAPNNWTIVARKSTFRAAILKVHATNPTVVVIR